MPIRTPFMSISTRVVGSRFIKFFNSCVIKCVYIFVKMFFFGPDSLYQIVTANVGMILNVRTSAYNVFPFYFRQRARKRTKWLERFSNRLLDIVPIGLVCEVIASILIKEVLPRGSMPFVLACLVTISRGETRVREVVIIFSRVDYPSFCMGRVPWCMACRFFLLVAGSKQPT